MAHDPKSCFGCKRLKHKPARNETDPESPNGLYTCLVFGRLAEDDRIPLARTKTCKERPE